MKNSLSFLVGAIALVACSESHGITYADPRQALAVAIDVSPSQFYSGDLTTVTLTLTNTSLHVTDFDASCPQWFIVRRDSLTVGPGTTGCAAIAVPVKLQPGESYKVLRPWNGTKLQASGSQSALSPGMYDVQAHVTFGSDVLLGPSQQIEILAH